MTLGLFTYNYILIANLAERALPQSRLSVYTDNCASQAIMQRTDNIARMGYRVKNKSSDYLEVD